MCLPKGISNGKRSRRPEKEPQLVDDSILLRDFRFRIIRNESKCSQKKKMKARKPTWRAEEFSARCGKINLYGHFVLGWRWAVGCELWVVGCPES